MDRPTEAYSTTISYSQVQQSVTMKYISYSDDDSLGEASWRRRPLFMSTCHWLKVGQLARSISVFAAQLDTSVTQCARHDSVHSPSYARWFCKCCVESCKHQYVKYVKTRPLETIRPQRDSTCWSDSRFHWECLGMSPYLVHRPSGQ